MESKVEWRISETGLSATVYSVTVWEGSSMRTAVHLTYTELLRLVNDMTDRQVAYEDSPEDEF